MPPSRVDSRVAIAAALSSVLGLSAPSAAAAASEQLAAAHRDAVAAASAAQRDERRINKLERDVQLLGQEIAGRQRGLDESRPQQRHLLDGLVLLARNLHDPFVGSDLPALDRLRGKLLIRSVAEGLRSEAAALMSEIAEVARNRSELSARLAELKKTVRTLADDRERVAQTVARRQELLAQVKTGEAADSERLTRQAREAKDVDQLIKSADAAMQRYDKGLLDRARAAVPKAKGADAAVEDADPTRPDGLHAFDPPQSRLTVPATGAVTPLAGTAGPGLTISAPPRATVVAPYDGRVVYTGPFRDNGAVLIIRHGDLYHSVMAGLGQAEVEPGEWVFAGEPVGAMPDAGGPLQFELRRDSRAVDVQPWLAHDEESGAAPEQENGGRKVNR